MSSRAPSRRNRKAAPHKGAAPAPPAPPPAPLRPWPRTFVVLLIVFALWMVALLGMYLVT